MNKISYCLLSLSIFCGCATGQEKTKNAENDKTGFQFIVETFKPGTYVANLMTGSENNDRRVELLQKMFNVVRDDYDWYLDFVKDAPNGLPIKYDSRLGISQEEFNEFTNIIDNYRMLSELEFDLKIKEDGSVLRFYSEYENELFKNLRIDIKNQKIYLGNYEFAMTDTIEVLNDNNRMGSKWSGYKWTYQVPEKIDFSNVAELVKKDAILYNIAFGILQPSETLYLSIQGVEVEGGIRKVNFTIPIFLKPK